MMQQVMGPTGLEGASPMEGSHWESPGTSGGAESSERTWMQMPAIRNLLKWHSGRKGEIVVCMHVQLFIYLFIYLLGGVKTTPTLIITIKFGHMWLPTRCLGFYLPSVCSRGHLHLNIPPHKGHFTLHLQRTAICQQNDHSIVRLHSGPWVQISTS